MRQVRSGLWVKRPLWLSCWKWATWEQGGGKEAGGHRKSPDRSRTKVTAVVATGSGCISIYSRTDDTC